ncbi:hypothetical protein GXP67_19675 [Rhodocytophaga rosea]|uniref:Uncharacterized protein n=1 Tax=Rhodocytophaga rosea TaxID=2704465 RepID=A0A6C0GLL6_9BACT|nr:hypothetical protein [Rhodocytophaga rosea]QHT68704.1 hypothetical protein GXP67_19675 [Rhodocytophaga rosea]
MNRKDEILAILIANTSRKNRSLDLVQIYSLIEEFIKHYGSINDLINALNISKGMLRKFTSIQKLSNPVRELVKKREIDSVEIVNSLSQLSFNEQYFVAEQIINKSFNSQDIRILTPLKEKFPDLPIQSLVEKVRDSKQLKISVIKFAYKDGLIEDKLRKYLVEYITSDNIIEINFKDEGIIKITKQGEKKLRDAAKLHKKTLSQFISKLIEQSYVKRP